MLTGPQRTRAEHRQDARFTSTGPVAALDCRVLRSFGRPQALVHGCRTINGRRSVKATSQARADIAFRATHHSKGTAYLRNAQLQRTTQAGDAFRGSNLKPLTVHWRPRYRMPLWPASPFAAFASAPWSRVNPLTSTLHSQYLQNSARSCLRRPGQRRSRHQRQLRQHPRSYHRHHHRRPERTRH